MTVGFDRTADCQGNHPSLTEFLRILTEHYWLCFDRTTSLTEHLGNLGFDRTVNGEMFCQKNVISRVFCHISFCRVESVVATRSVDGSVSELSVYRPDSLLVL